MGGSDGIVLDQVQALPLATMDASDSTVDSYKVCVCMPSGRVFLVPATYRCDQANEDQNPCVD